MAEVIFKNDDLLLEINSLRQKLSDLERSNDSLKSIEEALRRSNERLSALFDRSLDCVYELDFEGTFIDANLAALKLFGYERSELPSLSISSLFDSNDLSKAERCFSEVIITGSQNELQEFRAKRKDGGYIDIETKISIIYQYGKPRSILGVARDITTRKRMEESLRESEERYRILFEDSHDALITLSPPDWNFTSCNSATLKMLGIKDVAEFTTLRPMDISPEYQPDGRLSSEKAMEMIETVLRDGHHFFEWTSKSRNGETFPCTVQLSRIYIGGKVILHASLRDVTERKRYEEKLEYFAIHDQLTGLLNRHSLEDTLIRTIAKARRGSLSSILYMDLDNFKNVNDTVGHIAGDEVLITLAGLMKDTLRTEDIVFRLGGDEFAVILDGMDSREAFPAAERLRAIVAGYIFELKGRVFPLSLSIGIIEIDGIMTAVELLSRVDAAMYRAKAQGKNKVVVEAPSSTT